MRRLFAILLSALPLAACETTSAAFRFSADDPVEGAFSDALFQSAAVRLTPGHRVELVNNGALFDRLAQEVSRAKRSINIALFIWQPGTPSTRMVNAVTARAKAGVTCRVVVDAVASTAFDAEVRPALVAAGCDVRAFRPLTKGVSVDRNHRQIVVIDGKVGFTGGFGIADVWMGEGRKPGEWLESNVIVEGPAVNQLQQAFADDWKEVAGPQLPRSEFPTSPRRGPTRAAFISSRASNYVRKAEHLNQLLISSATKRVWIANADFVPSPGLVDLMIEKERQGVDVRIMVPGDQTDHPEVLLDQRASYARLLEGGVRIWEYQSAQLHSKTMVVDDQLSVVGSISLDRLARPAIEEGALLMSDPHVASQLMRAWEEDQTQCVLVSEE
ncbi:MAG: phospholipase D-like domain-containing protein [Archangium sp.]|nr:phospholipase D-like domain-containing protein [Archangium sp.]